MAFVARKAWAGFLPSESWTDFRPWTEWKGFRAASRWGSRRAKGWGLRTSRRRRSGTAAWSAVLASGVGAGALLYVLMDEGRRGKAAGALRGAKERAASGARTLGARASDVFQAAEAQVRARAERASEKAQALASRAKDAAGKAQALAQDAAGKAQGLAHDAQGRVQASGAVPEGETRRVGAAALLLARGAFGGGLLRVPFGLAGVSLAGQLAREAPPVRRGLGQATSLVRRATDGLRRAREEAERRAAGGQDAGASPSGGGSGQQASRGATGGGSGEQRRPKVERVGPGGIEPGIAHASPQGSDPGHQAAGAGYGASGGSPDLSMLGAAGSDDVERTRFDAPPAGAGVREEELGRTLPRDEESEEEPIRRGGRADDLEPTRHAGGADETTPLIASNDPIMPDADPAVNEGFPELGASRRIMDEEGEGSPERMTTPDAGNGAPRGDPLDGG